MPSDLGPGHTFTPKAQWTDELGQTHIRYVHRYQGLRVWGSEMVEHLGPRAAPFTLKLAVPWALPARAPVPAVSSTTGGEAILWPDTFVGGSYLLQDLTRGLNGPWGHHFVADGKYLPEPFSVYARPPSTAVY